MVYEARKIGYVKGLGEVYQLAAPLDEQLKAFARKGIHSLVSPDEVAQIRLAGLSNDFSRTSIAPVKIKGAKTILVRDSPLMNPLMASLAVKLHARGEYFTADKDVYEAAEALAKSQETISPEDRTAISVLQEGEFSLTPKMDEAKFVLRAQNAPYFKKFTKGKIQFLDISGDFKDKAIINYLWFDAPLNGSYLSCRNRLLNYEDTAFGVSAAGVTSAKKNGYTLTEIEIANSKAIPSVLQGAGVPALEKMLAKPLTRGLLDALRAQ